MSAFPGQQGPKHRFRRYWASPWLPAAAADGRFRSFCWRKGFVSPHFTRAETACHDPARTPIPDSLRFKAQRQAFKLEDLRHRLGDKPLPFGSWYRTPAWNAHEGGASQSRHIQADATDFFSSTVDSFNRTTFITEAEQVYANDGLGNEWNGSVHVDARGVRARWRYW